METTLSYSQSRPLLTTFLEADGQNLLRLERLYNQVMRSQLADLREQAGDAGSKARVHYALEAVDQYVVTLCFVCAHVSSSHYEEDFMKQHLTNLDVALQQRSVIIDSVRAHVV